MLKASEFRSVHSAEKAFLAEDIDESFPLMSRNLEAGDIPLYLNYGGKKYQVSEISASPYNVKRLLSICKVSLKNGDVVIPIQDITQYLKEVPTWI